MLHNTNTVRNGKITHFSFCPPGNFAWSQKEAILRLRIRYILLLYCHSLVALVSLHTFLWMDMRRVLIHTGLHGRLSLEIKLWPFAARPTQLPFLLTLSELVLIRTVHGVEAGVTAGEVASFILYFTGCSSPSSLRWLGRWSPTALEYSRGPWQMLLKICSSVLADWVIYHPGDISWQWKSQVFNNLPDASSVFSSRPSLSDIL